MNKLWSSVGRVIDWVSAALMVSIVLTVAAQIVYRYFLKDPLVGSEDLAKLAMVWMIFLAVSLVTRDREHIRVDYFVDKFPPALRDGVDRAVDLIVLAFLGLAVVQGVAMIPDVMGMKSVGLNLSLGWYAAALPVGLGLALAHAVLSFAGRRHG